MIMPASASPDHGGTAQGLEALLAEGEQQAQAGDLEAAVRSYEKAVAMAPESADARMKLAGMQVLRGQYSDSIENFRRVISAQPENANAFVGMGIAYLHLGNYALARAALEEALNRDENKREELQKVLDWLESRVGQGMTAQDSEKPAFE